LISYFLSIGQGVLYNDEVQNTTENLNYRDFDEIDNYWIKYEGQFKDDDKNG